MKVISIKQIVLIMVISLIIVGCSNPTKETTITNKTTNEDTAIDSDALSQTEEVIEITFWDENAGPNRTPYYEELISRFHEANPAIHVKYVGIPWSSAKNKYDVAAAANALPDIAGIPNSWISGLMAKDVVIPLDDYFNNWDEKDQFIVAYIDANRDIGNGVLYQLPNTSTGGVIWYRPDVFEEKGITLPKTWDDFYDVVEKLSDVDHDFYGFSIRGGAGSSYPLQELLVSQSGIEDYFDDNGKCMMNDPRVVTALEQFVSIYGENTPESDITNGYKEMVAAFDTGITGMIQHNLGSYGEHEKTLGEGKFAALPLFQYEEGKTRLLTSGNSGYSLFESDSAKRQAAAWTFMKFLCSEDSIDYWNYNIGQIPTRKDVIQHDWVNERQHIKVISEVVNNENTTLVNSPMELPGYGAIHNETLQPMFQELLIGDITAQEYLDKWAELMETEWQESYGQ